jgi:hypothetical protein
VTFDGGSFSASGVGANYAASDLAIGAELSNFTATAPGNPGNAFDASGWTTGASASLGSSMFFTLTPAANYALTITGIAFDYRPQGSGPQEIGVRVEVGGGSPSLFVPLNNDDNSPGTLPADTYKTWATYSRAGTLNSSAGEAVTLFLTGFDSQNSGKSMSIDNISVNGTVTVVPEPSSLGQTLIFLALSALCVTWRYRRETL